MTINAENICYRYWLGFTNNTPCSSNKVIALASMVCLRLPPKLNVSLRRKQTNQPWATVSTRTITPATIKTNKQTNKQKTPSPGGFTQLRLISYWCRTLIQFRWLSFQHNSGTQAASLLWPSIDQWSDAGGGNMEKPIKYLSPEVISLTSHNP